MKRGTMIVMAAAVLALAGCTCTTPTRAADLRGAAPAPLAPPVLAEDFSSGWYVRGDFTASLPAAFRDGRMANAYGGGFGVGFKYKWARFDTVVDLRSSAVVTDFAPAAVGRFGVSSQTVLANAYLDLGPLGPLSPYIGAGVGVARVQSAVGTAGFTGATRWNVAFAAMAGVTIDLTPQMKLDVGYRYIQMGSARIDDLAGSYRVPATSHEIRIGLRYMFGDGLDGVQR